MKCHNLHKCILLSLTAIAGSGCSDSIQYSEKYDTLSPITLSAAYPSATRASDAGFEDGDKMGLYVLDYFEGAPQDINDPDVNASNVRFEFHASDNSWKGVTDVYWKNGSTPADIIGYYPYVSGIVDPEEMSFSVSNHQDAISSDSSLGGYESSDLLWGDALKQMPSAGKVQLTLNHILAGVRINLREGSGFGSGEWSDVEKSVVIPSTILGGSVNLRDGSVKIGSSSPKSIVPMQYNGDYRAIIFPQEVTAGTSLVSVSVDGVGYNLVRQEPVSFIGGKMHTFTITVDKKSNGNYEFSLSDEAIVQWTDDAEFRDGVIRSYTTVDVLRRGSLKNIIIKGGLNYKEISNLKLTGEIDENDFFFMRDEMISLKSLNLKDVRVYDGDRSDVIPAKAMYCKTTLARIIFPDHLKIIGSSAFHRTGLMGDLIIPEGVEKIGESIEPEYIGYISVGNVVNGTLGAFSYCDNLHGSLSLPSTLTHIEHGAFTYDRFEGNLFLPKKLRFIGDYAFCRNQFTGELNIPESIDYIGSGSFEDTHFSGSLEIPEGIEVIKSYAFCDASFSGSLILPEGILEIQKHAFDGCNFRGELLLPTSVRSLGDYAFSNTRISNIVFPKNLTSIGKGCFMNCSYLNEKIIIPENVTRLNEYVFAGCMLLSEVELHENVTFVGGGAFAGDKYMSEITVKNPNPPYISIVSEPELSEEGFEIGDIEMDPFYGIPLGNVTLKIPAGAKDDYSRAESWKNIFRQAVYNGFGCRPSRICALNASLKETVTVDGKGEWEVTHMPSWCKVSVNSGNGKTQISVSISEMPIGNGNREDYLEFKMKGSDYTARCTLSQIDYKYKENECITLQMASKGNGIDILFVGDGFDAMSIANEEYLDLVNEQMDAFFGVEPYATYRDYFNVYACMSLSQEVGVSTTSIRKNTRFQTRFDNGTGCSIKSLACNSPDLVFDYAAAYSPLTPERMPQSLIIMTLNSDQYGSVTTLSESGAAIAIVGRSSDPYPFDTRGMIQHEACGHAFGKLAEERIVENRYIKDKEKSVINEGFWRGWYQNISLTSKLNEVSWADLIFDSRYSNKVDVFEGGYGVTKGVYRAEINSCMNYGIPYFSAPARLDIMRRILEYSGEGFTMEKFYATDSDKWGSTGSTRSAMPEANNAYVNSGMHHPVRIVKSRKY